MDVPGLIEQRLEDETPRDVVNLGGDDRAVFTPDRTLVYRAESLLSDAGVEKYSHDVQRLSVSSGRRKSTFILESIDGTERLRVPNEVATAVLERLLGGILDAAGVIDDDEEVKGVYRFSDLTLVVTDARVVKHIGPAIWDEEYEEVPFSAITGLDFEEGRVAMQVAITVEGRVERIKAPNEEAPVLRRTLTEAVLDYHDFDSVEELNESLGVAEEETPSDSPYPLDESISPLIKTEQSSTPAADDGSESVRPNDDLDRGSESVAGTSSAQQEQAKKEEGEKKETQTESAESSPAMADVEAAEPDGHTVDHTGDQSDNDTGKPGSGPAQEASSESAPTAGEWSSVAGDSMHEADSPAGGPSESESLEREIERLSDAVEGLTDRVERHSELLEQQSTILAALHERISDESSTDETSSHETNSDE